MCDLWTGLLPTFDGSSSNRDGSFSPLTCGGSSPDVAHCCSHSFMDHPKLWRGLMSYTDNNKTQKSKTMQDPSNPVPILDHFFVKSHKISSPHNQHLEQPYCFIIWQVARQLCLLRRLSNFGTIGQLWVKLRLRDEYNMYIHNTETIY